MPSEPRIGETLTHIAETFSRLLVQHAQLLRAEVEAEARALNARIRKISRAALTALPFIIAGVAIVSLAVAQLVGLALEPRLGRAAAPIVLLALGLCEVAVAGFWLHRVLARTPDTEAARGGTEAPLPLPAVRQDQAPPSERRPTVLQWSRMRSYTTPASPAIEENAHG
jgi:hypothetical protein